jgi:hypothetical protein
MQVVNFAIYYWFYVQWDFLEKMLNLILSSCKVGIVINLYQL